MLFWNLFGPVLTVSLIVLSVLLAAIAIYLVSSSQRAKLGSALMPFCFVPFAVGSISGFMRIVSSLEIQLDGPSDFDLDPTVLLTMNFLPLLAGIIASLPAYFILAAGNWRIAWRANSLPIPSENKPAKHPEDYDPIADLERETDQYLDQLTKPR